MLAGVLDAGRRRHFIEGTVGGRKQRFVLERYGVQYFLYYWPKGFVATVNADRVLAASGDTYEVKKKRVKLSLPELQAAIRDISPLTGHLGGMREELDTRYATEQVQTKQWIRAGKTPMGDRIEWVALEDLDDLKTYVSHRSRLAEALRGFRQKKLLPPIIIGTYDGKRHIIDGNHRLTAARKLGVEKVLVAFAPEAES